MYNAMVRDANRNVFTVNGTKINPKNGQQELVGQLKSHLPDAQDQRFISKLINQRMQGDWQMLIANGMLPDGRMAEQVPGTAGIPVKPGGNMMFQSDLKGVSNTYEVTVAPDGKTATVTSTSTSALHFLDGQKISGAMTSYGAVWYTFNFTLTLSGHQDGQGVTSFSVGQQFMTTEEALATGAKLS